MLALLSCRPPAPAAAPGESVVHDALYFVLVDRFNNADPSNDLDARVDDPQAWHGGDLAGVRAKVDYLADLGVGAVWLSPITASQHRAVGEWGAFHGYWVNDHRAVEPRFGTVQDARDLRDALHARGMGLYLDMVWNHAGYDAPLVTERPGWFHNLGDVVEWDDPVEAVTHDVHGLPDLRQEDPKVHTYLRDASEWWIREVEPTGFRVDAVRHLPSGFVRRISDELRARHPGFVLLGEHFEGDPHALAARYRSDRLDAVFDFPMHYAMKDVFCSDAPVGRIASTLAADRAYGAPPGASGPGLVPFLDNHDVPRIASACHGDLDRVARALAFMITTRGTPCIYQGTEVGQLGSQEPANRADMAFDDQHPLAETLRGLLALRARHAVLRDGVTRIEALGPDHLLYSRITASAVARIAVNTGPEPWTPPVPTDQAEFEPSAQWLVTGTGPLTASEGGAVPPAAVRVDLLHGNARALRDITIPGATDRATLSIIAEGAPATPGDRVLLVGAGEALGGWSPARGVPARRTARGWMWTLDVAQGDVLAFKIVVDGPDGTRWSPGPDRYAWAHAANDRLVMPWDLPPG
ncbi:MAG: glycosidase [Myxococcota bacterium]|jgi:glycosidase